MPWLGVNDVGCSRWYVVAFRFFVIILHVCHTLLCFQYVLLSSCQKCHVRDFVFVHLPSLVALFPVHSAAALSRYFCHMRHARGPGRGRCGHWYLELDVRQSRGFVVLSTSPVYASWRNAVPLELDISAIVVNCKNCRQLFSVSSVVVSSVHCSKISIIATSFCRIVGITYKSLIANFAFVMCNILRRQSNHGDIIYGRGLVSIVHAVIIPARN